MVEIVLADTNPTTPSSETASKTFVETPAANSSPVEVITPAPLPNTESENPDKEGRCVLG